MSKPRDNSGVNTGGAGQKGKGSQVQRAKQEKSKKEFDPVEEASKESFPASDAPAW